MEYIVEFQEVRPDGGGVCQTSFRVFGGICFLKNSLMKRKVWSPQHELPKYVQLFTQSIFRAQYIVLCLLLPFFHSIQTHLVAFWAEKEGRTWDARKGSNAVFRAPFFAFWVVGDHREIVEIGDCRNQTLLKLGIKKPQHRF